MPALLEQLRDLRRRVRRLLWLNGLSRSVAGLLGGAMLLGGGDWLWHFDDRGLRAGLLAILLAIVGVVAWRRLVGPLRSPLSNVELSGQLERWFPDLRGRLATAVEFLECDLSPQVGSPELQRRLIEQTTADVRSLDFSEVLDRREARRAALALAALVSVALLLTATNSAAASLSMRRVLWPLSDQRWPQSVALQLVRGDLSLVSGSLAEPLRSVQGQPLDLFVVNARGALPQPVLIEFRQHGRMPQSEPMRTATLRGTADQSREAGVIRLPIDEGVIEFRAVGGDDHEMPWRELRITPPPKVASFRVQIQPPSYTGESMTTLPEGATQVRTTLGARLLITARVSRPVRKAEWTIGVGQVSNLSAKLSVDGHDLRAEVSVTHAGSAALRLSLIDRDGFENTSALRLEVIGTADPPPTVMLDEPATDQLVTANATIRIQATARDDRRLRDVGLEHLVGQVSNLRVSADRAPASGDTNEANWQVENLPHENATREANVKLDWSLSPLSLPVGERVALRVIASDHCDVGEPRVGRSAVRMLMIVTPEAKLAEIALRLDLLLREIESLAARQSQAKDQTENLRVQAEKTADLRPQDRDSLKRLEMDQRHIGTRLIAPRRGSHGDDVTAHARELLGQLESNQLHDSATRERLTRIATAIEALSRDTLPALESTLGRVVKETLSGSPVSDAARSFADVVTRQSEVLATLTELVRDLTQWRDRRELAREVAELANAQESLNRDTSELAPQTLGKSATQLPSQQQADVAKLADRQSRQAERIEQLRQRLAQSSQDQRESETPVEPNKDEGAAKEVVAELDRLAVVAKAREAAQQVAANNLGQAGRTQQQLAEELRSLADKLAQTSSANDSSDVAELTEIGKQLDSLIQRQRQLRDETRDAAAKTDKLTPEQQAEPANALRERQGEAKKSADELTSRLKGSRAAESLDALRRASRHMQQAESQLGDKQLERGADESQAALDDLEQASRELAAARKTSQQEQFAEKVNALVAAVRELIARQQTVVDETQRLADEQQQAGKWTRPLSKAALNLSEAEQELAAGTRELSESLRDVAAVRLTLDRAAGDLSVAATRMRDKLFDDETRRREQLALRSLQSLATALSPPKPEQSPNENTAQQPAEQNQNPGPQEPVPPVALLQLLRHLQVDVGERTRNAETRKPSTPKEDEVQQREAEVRLIAGDQQSLRDATSELLDQIPTGSEAADDEDKPRESTLSGMRQSFAGLQGDETGQPTQAAQKTTVESLDTLLKLWQQRAAKQQSLASTKQPAPMSDQPPGDNSTTTDGSGGKPTGRDSKQARNSSDRDRTGTDVEGELRRQRQLRESVWGHLPPALREKMLNLPHDKTLPKYSEHIRRYYEALAEQVE